MHDAFTGPSGTPFALNNLGVRSTHGLRPGPSSGLHTRGLRASVLGSCDCGRTGRRRVPIGARRFLFPSQEGEYALEVHHLWHYSVREFQESPYNNDIMDRSRTPRNRLRGWVRKRSRESASASLTHLGLTYALAIILYGLGGWWLDGRLGTQPWFTLLGVALGAVGGFIWVYREVMSAQDGDREEKDERDKP